MTEFLKRIIGQPGRRAFVQGMGSVLDLGGSGKRSRVMVFHARPAGQSIRDAWQAAVGTLSIEVATKGSK